jgi:hypothetical protein
MPFCFLHALWCLHVCFVLRCDGLAMRPFSGKEGWLPRVLPPLGSTTRPRFLFQSSYRCAQLALRLQEWFMAVALPASLFLPLPTWRASGIHLLPFASVNDFPFLALVCLWSYSLKSFSMLMVVCIALTCIFALPSGIVNISSCMFLYAQSLFCRTPACLTQSDQCCHRPGFI